MLLLVAGQVAASREDFNAPHLPASGPLPRYDSVCFFFFVLCVVVVLWMHPVVSVSAESPWQASSLAARLQFTGGEVRRFPPARPALGAGGCGGASVPRGAYARVRWRGAAGGVCCSWPPLVALARRGALAGLPARAHYGRLTDPLMLPCKLHCRPVVPAQGAAFVSSLRAGRQAGWEELSPEGVLPCCCAFVLAIALFCSSSGHVFRPVV